jgi:hypothetical protein
MRKRIYLVPLGGLGNRVRFVLSGLQALSKYNNIDVTVVNFKTSMFPGSLNSFIEIPRDAKIINFGRINDKVLNLSFRLLCKINSLFSKKLISVYGTRSIQDLPRIIVSFNEIENSGEYKVLLRCTGVAERESKVYDAIHIRRGDNLRARSANRIESFTDFIVNSDLRVYVASDDENLKDELKHRFGDKIIIRKVGLNRSSEQDLATAFDELCTCVKARSFMGSKGSSFSKIIQAARSSVKCD